MQSEQNQPKNLKWTFRNHSVGMIAENDFQWVEEKAPDAGAGEVLIRNVYLSLDPTNRVWMGEKDTYMPVLKRGEVMRGLAIGVVEKSNHPGFKAGDWVQGLLGWQKYLVSNGEGLIALPQIPGLPLEAHFGLLGHIGLTAHYGLLQDRQGQAGETVVVSAAAGAVGSLTGQIARIQGVPRDRYGGQRREMPLFNAGTGFSTGHQLQNRTAAERLQALCPRGLTCTVDNVGGATLDAVLDLINDLAGSWPAA
jgi:NADPH-dependent curcumin reductase CurA